jgi:lipopolysaccharide transport system permease protein
MEMMRALWAYRGFITGSVQREFQTRYRNSALGAVWSVLNPLSMIFVYTVIFAQVMRARLPGLDSTFAYSVYLCAGILTWGLFAEITNRSLTMFVENANLLKKLSFPRLCLPVTVVATACLNFFIVFALFTAFLVVTGNFPGLVYFAVLPVLAVHVALAVGLGVGMGLLNVFFRDVGQFYGIVLQFWFWLTPIVYPLNILPETFQAIIKVNPLTHLATAYQDILVRGNSPEWRPLLVVGAIAAALCFLSLRLFKRRSAEMVDEL